jgi:hypothetical protein
MFIVKEVWQGPASMEEVGTWVGGEFQTLTDALWFGQQWSNEKGYNHEVIPEGEFHKRWWEPFLFYTMKPEKRS